MAKGTGDEEGTLPFGVSEGAEIKIGTLAWNRLTPVVGSVLEVCLLNSSIGLGAEDWFAVLVTEWTGLPDEMGRTVKGEFLGVENELHSEEIQAAVAEGGVHLCGESPCSLGTDATKVHATIVRCWHPVRFDADYLTGEGRKAIKKAVTALKKEAAELKKKTTRGPPRRRAATGSRPKAKAKGQEEKDVTCIELDSEGEHEAEVVPGEAGVDRATLRKMLASTRERIMGGGLGAANKDVPEAAAGGRKRKDTDCAPARRGLMAGTHLVPGQGTRLALEGSGGTRDGEENNWMQKIKKGGSTSVQLLAQAVQSAQIGERRRKKKEKEKKGPIDQLVKLLKGERGDKKKKKKKKRKDRPRQGGDGLLRVKPDPGGSGGSGSSSSDSESSSAAGGGKEGDSGEDSDLSCEPPLKKKASKDPGSVLAMLVRHAQEQLDKGALMEEEGSRSSVVTGIKIATYFGLLIRPYHPQGSPLLRELYSLAQAIDLLRQGRLPEAGDALAARFIAVHTALGEGGWQTASQLELHPLEPVQSTSTATMLLAQKHRRLVLKSQGVTPGRWWGGGRGKGYGGQEKGKKGDPGKGRGKGKGKGGKESGWGSKGENNPWKENKEEAPKK